MEVWGIYKKKFLSPSVPSQFNFSSAVSDKVFKLRKQGKSQEEESKVKWFGRGGPLAGGESPLVTSLGEKLLTFHYSGIFAFALDGIVRW